MASGKAVVIFPGNARGDLKNFDLAAVSAILDRVGNCPLAVISSNGKERTGKSFLLTQLMHAKLIDKEFPGFEWQTGDEPHTAGIQMWSEPFFLRDRSGDEVALVLIDTQGFDAPGNVVQLSCQTHISMLSLLMSSLHISNVNGPHFLERGLNPLAINRLSGYIDLPVFDTDSCLLQTAVYLVHDWEDGTDYEYGLHKADRSFPKGVTKNVFDHPSSKQNVIFKLFSDRYAYLLPHPGTDRVGKSDFVFDETRGFDQQLSKCFHHIFGKTKQYIKPRTIYGRQQTGNNLKELITRWSEMFRLHNGNPPLENLSGVILDMHLEGLVKSSMNYYDLVMDTMIKKGVEDEDAFAGLHMQTCLTSLDMFHNEAIKFGKTKLEYGKDLQKYFGERCFFYDTIFLGKRNAELYRQLDQMRLSNAEIQELKRARSNDERKISFYEKKMSALGLPLKPESDDDDEAIDFVDLAEDIVSTSSVPSVETYPAAVVSENEIRIEWTCVIT